MSSLLCGGRPTVGSARSGAQSPMATSRQLMWPSRPQRRCPPCPPRGLSCRRTLTPPPQRSASTTGAGSELLAGSALVRHCSTGAAPCGTVRTALSLCKPANYNHNSYRCRWESQGYFKPNMDAKGEAFTIPMPPPNVTGKLHMGHAMFATLQVIEPCSTRALCQPCSCVGKLSGRGSLPRTAHSSSKPTDRR
jgi:hypothetical protein